MDLFIISLAAGALSALGRHRLIALASPHHRRVVGVASTFATTTCLAIALLSLPSALVSMSPGVAEKDLRRVAEALSPPVPASLGGGLTLEEVHAREPSGLVFRCSFDQESKTPLPEVLGELRRALEASRPTQELVSMGMTLTYSVVDRSGAALGEVVVPSP